METHLEALPSGLLRHRHIIGGLIILSFLVMAGCGGPVYTEPEQVRAEPPEVGYNFSTDEGLLEASDKARIYCTQYGASPSIVGSIVENEDGSKTVTFECIKTAADTDLPPPPRTYSYTTDLELLEALEAANTYCAQRGEIASTDVVTNPDGTRMLTFECIPR